jgi:hypothetical protein
VGRLQLRGAAAFVDLALRSHPSAGAAQRSDRQVYVLYVWLQALHSSLDIRHPVRKVPDPVIQGDHLSLDPLDRGVHPHHLGIH